METRRTPTSPSAARHALRTIMSAVGKHGGHSRRVHMQAMETMAHTDRALAGLCGHCGKCAIFLSRQDGKTLPVVLCAAGNSPIDLYRGTPLGEEASCNSFAQASQHHDEIAEPNSGISPNDEDAAAGH